MKRVRTKRGLGIGLRFAIEFVGVWAFFLMLMLPFALGN